MSPHPLWSRLAQALRQARSGLRGRHAVALSAVAVMAFGLVGLRTVDLPEPDPVTDDGRLRIEVVHPVEPEIVPGSVMDVGELVDGFQGVPPPLPSLTDVLWSYDEGWETWKSDASRRPEDLRMTGARAYYSAPELERSSPPGALRRWFGFDAPRRDFQAERAARRARLEAMEQRAREHRDWERRRHQQRAGLDHHALEGWRIVPREAPAWRDISRRRDERRDDEWRGGPGRDDSPDDDRRLRSDEGPVPYEPHDAEVESIVGFDG